MYRYKPDLALGFAQTTFCPYAQLGESKARLINENISMPLQFSYSRITVLAMFHVPQVIFRALQ